ncbi:MAG: hypothetical protein E7361_03680 [Clostridiales bacterium]|nr:hypothetical protein [Clostridiales bacterium]
MGKRKINQGIKDVATLVVAGTVALAGAATTYVQIKDAYVAKEELDLTLWSYTDGYDTSEYRKELVDSYIEPIEEAFKNGSISVDTYANEIKKCGDRKVTERIMATSENDAERYFNAVDNIEEETDADDIAKGAAGTLAGIGGALGFIKKVRAMKSAGKQDPEREA